MYPERPGDKGRARRTGAPCRRRQTGLSRFQERARPLGRARNNRTVAHRHDRTLHQLWMLEQERHHGVGGGILGGIQPQLLEAPVFTHQLGRRGVNHGHEPFQRGAVQRILEIFDSVELDATRAQQLQRAA